MEMFTEENAANNKQRMIEAAFIAWQLKDTKKMFVDYLKDLGLAEKKTAYTKQGREADLEKYRRIVEKVRKAGNKK